MEIGWFEKRKIKKSPEYVEIKEQMEKFGSEHFFRDGERVFTEAEKRAIELVFNEQNIKLHMDIDFHGYAGLQSKEDLWPVLTAEEKQNKLYRTYVVVKDEQSIRSIKEMVSGWEKCELREMEMANGGLLYEVGTEDNFFSHLTAKNPDINFSNESIECFSSGVKEDYSMFRNLHHFSLIDALAGDWKAMPEDAELYPVDDASRLIVSHFERERFRENQQVYGNKKNVFEFRDKLNIPGSEYDGWVFFQLKDNSMIYATDQEGRWIQADLNASVLSNIIDVKESRVALEIVRTRNSNDLESFEKVVFSYVDPLKYWKAKNKIGNDLKSKEMNVDYKYDEVARATSYNVLSANEFVYVPKFESDDKLMDGLSGVYNREFKTYLLKKEDGSWLKVHGGVFNDELVINEIVPKEVMGWIQKADINITCDIANLLGKEIIEDFSEYYGVEIIVELPLANRILEDYKEEQRWGVGADLWEKFNLGPKTDFYKAVVSGVESVNINPEYQAGEKIGASAIQADLKEYAVSLNDAKKDLKKIMSDCFSGEKLKNSDVFKDLSSVQNRIDFILTDMEERFGITSNKTETKLSSYYLDNLDRVKTNLPEEMKNDINSSMLINILEMDKSDRNTRDKAINGLHVKLSKIWRESDDPENPNYENASRSLDRLNDVVQIGVNKERQKSKSNGKEAGYPRMEDHGNYPDDFNPNEL